MVCSPSLAVKLASASVAATVAAKALAVTEVAVANAPVDVLRIAAAIAAAAVPTSVVGTVVVATLAAVTAPMVAPAAVFATRWIECVAGWVAAVAMSVGVATTVVVLANVLRAVSPAEVVARTRVGIPPTTTSHQVLSPGKRLIHTIPLGDRATS